MRAIIRPGLLALSALGVLAGVSDGLAQAPPATKGEAPPPSVAPSPVRADVAKQVVAVVNGEKITRGELADFLNRFPIPADNAETIYRDAVDTLVNMHLVVQYVSHLNIPVPQGEVDKAISNLEQELKSNGRSIADALLESNKSLEEVRKEYANTIRWVTYVKTRGTDATLKKFAASHKDLLNNTQVQASHILLKVEPEASSAEKAKIRQKLIGIKKDIESKKYTFAQAANKFSEDPANSEGAGGSIGYFGLNSGIVEEFSKVAFSMKPGEVSDPVETFYGYHLISVTDRKEGKPIDFERNRPLITKEFSADLQREVLEAQRKSAKIEIKPMPADFFQAVPDEPTDKPKGAAPAGAKPK
jgi:peptidyl-prolyl cis-trans isomerase C